MAPSASLIHNRFHNLPVFYQNGTVVKELIVWPESPSIVLVVLIWLSVVFLENKAFSEAAKIVVVETETSLISLYENSLPQQIILRKPICEIKKSESYKIFFFIK
jgi:hypothetical protein